LHKLLLSTSPSLTKVGLCLTENLMGYNPTGCITATRQRN